MTFAGAKFLFQLLSSFVTLVATILFYLIISNIFFGVKTQAGWKIGLIIVALGVGLGAAYISYKLTSKFPSQLLLEEPVDLDSNLLVTSLESEMNMLLLVFFLLESLLVFILDIN